MTESNEEARSSPTAPPLREPPPPADPLILDVLARLEHGARLVRTWRSSHAQLYCYELSVPAGDPQRVVVKRFEDPQKAAASYDAMRSLADFLDSGSIPEVVSVRPLALDLPKRALVMPYVEGRTLREHLRDGGPGVVDFIRSAGAVLAKIHSAGRSVRFAEAAPEGGGWDDPLMMTGRTSERAVRRHHLVARPADVVRRIADYHPNNIFLRPDGRLALLDPLACRRRACYLHHDLAYFLYKSHRSLVARPRSPRGVVHAVRDYSGYAEAFLAGYSAAWERPLGVDDLRALQGYLWLYSRSRGARGRAHHRLLDIAVFGPLLRQQTRGASSHVVRERLSTATQ